MPSALICRRKAVAVFSFSSVCTHYGLPLCGAFFTSGQCTCRASIYFFRPSDGAAHYIQAQLNPGAFLIPVRSAKPLSFLIGCQQLCSFSQASLSLTFSSSIAFQSSCSLRIWWKLSLLVTGSPALLFQRLAFLTLVNSILRTEGGSITSVKW